ncbi:ADOP family duplicated permease [Silvibacterium acidisoli]|uniref:ADOP family duplicated permease n=1 Tax=Acidobacteriaceae bacterium ZG23-2 TaxID=2883246 RepID=UPI00406CE4F7
METPRGIFEKFLSFFRQGRLDGDLEAEMESHLEMAIEENLDKGMSHEEARRQALVRFGGVTQARQQHRDARSLPMLEVLMQDLRYCFRTMRRDRAFTIIAVLILGLGIGANIAVFSVVNTILLRPLPFHDPQQLVRITDLQAKSGESSRTYSADAWDQYREQTHTLSDITGYFAFSSENNYKLTGNGQPKPFTGILVAGNFFHTLGVTPTLGRDFTPDETVLHGRPVVLLTHPFWQSQFHADENIVGRSVDIDGKPVTVVGVLPESFDFGAVFAPGTRVDAIFPVVMDEIRSDGNTLALVARLMPGATIGQAQAEANQIVPKFLFSRKHPDYGAGYRADLLDLKDYVSGKLRRSLIALWWAVGLIMLIVCVNLSNLMLARSAARSKEFAMRTALGARRSRLVRQLLTESLVLAFAGATLGLAFAYSVVQYLAHQGSIALPLLSSIRLDSRALAWTLLIAVSAAVLFGLFPAIRMSRTDIQEALKDSGHGTSAGRRHERMRSALVVSEVALACVLLVGAGLLLRSFLHVLDVDLGFTPSQASSIQIEFDYKGDLNKAGQMLQDILGRVHAIPGVEAAGVTDSLPMARNRSWGIKPKGVPQFEKFEGIFVYMISPGYLDALGLHLREGRDIRWDDNKSAQNVVILNEATAKTFWPGQNPIDRMVTIGGDEARVIGVISDVRESGAETVAGFQAYMPAMQRYAADSSLVVRSKLPPASLATPIMSALRAVDPDQPSTQLHPIQMLVDHAVSPRKFFVLLVSIFAELGLLLAMLGIYGVISYSVSQQTQEIGIRMALGATRANVQFGVMSRTMKLAMAGIVIGSIASVVMARWIAALLFGTSPADPLTFGGMVLIMAAVAFIAGFIPAIRASRIQPMVALRNQ